MTTLFEQAVADINAGNTEEGKRLLVEIIRQNPRDENAWLWMTKCVTDVGQKRDCFERVLKINPQNPYALEGLRRLNQPAPSSPQPISKPTSIKRRRASPMLIGVLASVVFCVGCFGVVILLRVLPTLGSIANAPIQTPASITNSFITVTPYSGKWKVSKSISEFDNSTTVAITLDAENSIKGWLTVTIPTLVLRCQEGKIDAYVNNGTQANVESARIGMATVRIRFDQNPSFDLVTNESTDGESLFFVLSKYSVIIAMLRSREMVYGFTPFNASPVVTTFDLRGLSSVIDPLEKSCNWNGEMPTPISFPTP